MYGRRCVMSENREDIKDRSDTHAGRVMYAGGAIAAAGGATSMVRGMSHHAKNLGNKIVGKPGAVRPKLAHVKRGGAAVALGLAALAEGHHLINRTYQHNRTNRNHNT